MTFPELTQNLRGMEVKESLLGVLLNPTNQMACLRQSSSYFPHLKA